jgi:phosphoribosylanthranilate isomerase
MTWIKICGNTNLDDALAAVSAGADALGFIFAPSPRRVSPKEAKRIVAELPREVEKIGVFVNQSTEIIRSTIETVGLTGVQLHGDEDADFIRDLHSQLESRAMYRAAPMNMLPQNGRAADLLAYVEAGCDGLLLDSGDSARRGGTGRSFAWDEAAPLVQLLARKTRVIVAGGLTVANVAKAIETFRPFGVDVVSGVEREPGKKDEAKLRAFMEAARSPRRPQHVLRADLSG